MRLESTPAPAAEQRPTSAAAMPQEQSWLSSLERQWLSEWGRGDRQEPGTFAEPAATPQGRTALPAATATAAPQAVGDAVAGLAAPPTDGALARRQGRLVPAADTTDMADATVPLQPGYAAMLQAYGLQPLQPTPVACAGLGTEPGASASSGQVAELTAAKAVAVETASVAPPVVAPARAPGTLLPAGPAAEAARPASAAPAPQSSHHEPPAPTALTIAVERDQAQVALRDTQLTPQGAAQSAAAMAQQLLANGVQRVRVYVNGTEHLYRNPVEPGHDAAQPAAQSVPSPTDPREHR